MELYYALGDAHGDHRVGASGAVGTVRVVGGCGDDGLTAWQGIYLLDDWTSNEASCDAEGPSILAQRSETALFVKEENIFGVEFVNVVLCTDVADCEAMLSEDTIFLGNGYAFESGSDGSGWTGRTVFASGFDECTGSVHDHEMTSPADGVVRIETRRREAQPFPVDEDGFCATEDAEEAAEGQPCVSLEVVTASFTAEL